MRWTFHPHALSARWIFFFLTVVLSQSTGCQMWRRVGVSSSATIASRQYVQQAVESLQENEEQQAREKLLLALKTNPGNAEARVMYADVMWDAGQFEEAILHLKQVADTAEASGTLYVKLARMYFQTGNLEMSQRYLTAGIRRDTEQSDAWVLQGQIYAVNGHRNDAMLAFHQAIFHDAENWRAYVYLADVYLVMNRPQRALETAQFARQKFPPDQEPVEVLYSEGLAMARLGRYPEAVEVLALADVRRPGDIRVLTNLAESQYRAGHVAEAVATAKRGLHVTSDNARCLQLVKAVENAVHMEIAPQIGGDSRLPLTDRKLISAPADQAPSTR